MPTEGAGTLHLQVLNCGHAAVRAMLLSTLRCWALGYGIDGFCFVNAENMAQGESLGLIGRACLLGTT